MADAKEMVILMDNGSLRAEATLQLRRIASVLSEKIGVEVHPVSLLHSSKIDPEALGGQKAKTLVPFLREQKELGHSRFKIVPLFFGPSGALADYLPKRIADLRAEGWEELELEIAPTLVQPEDDRIARVLADLVKEQAQHQGWSDATVAMCDHGTPAKAVNVVRELVAEQLAGLLSESGMRVQSCSMERREEAEYDFNEPLLENLLGSNGYDRKVIVSMLFLLPGRHAGEEGDVAQICADAEKECESLQTVMTDLVGSKVEEVTEILKDRYADQSVRV